MIARAQEQQALEISRTTGINGLRCRLDSLDNYGHIVRCEGTIRNIGQSTYDKIVVTVNYKNDEGRVIDKKTVYALLYTELYPGESVCFNSSSVAKNICSANVSISDFNEI